MTTLQELDRKIEDSLAAHFGAFGISVSVCDGNITDGAISIRDNAIKEIVDMFHSATEKSYLAGKEDEKKRTAGEIMKIKKQILKSLSRHPNWTYEDIEADIDEEVEKFTEEIPEEIPLFEGTLKQLEDLKQSIIK
jgi:hypothetical protein